MAQANVPANLRGVVAIAAGYVHSLALKSNGTVVAWGDNGAGQRNVPAGLSGVVAIATFEDHNLALKSNGTVVAWGDNDEGQTNVPEGLDGVIAIAAGSKHSLAVKSKGEVIAWGDDWLGQVDVPAGLNGVTSAAAGGEHSLALKSDGTVVAWGDDDQGQATVPAGLDGVVAVASGPGHNLALKSDGTIVAWGSNFNGESVVPTSLLGIVAVAAGYDHCLALNSNGTVVAWGYNVNGMASIPAGLSEVAAIAAGEEHSLALKNNGTIVAWGSNDDGQANVPAGLGGVVAVAAGSGHNLALKSNGTVIAWGNNRDGQATVPSGVSEIAGIAAGREHNLALKSDGTVIAWGSNSAGQTTVPDGLSGVIAIAAGADHSLALKSNGEVVAWGDDWDDQASVPQGLNGVISIAAGSRHSMALKRDGTIVVWGKPHFSVSLGGTIAISAKGEQSLLLWDNEGIVPTPDTSAPVLSVTSPANNAKLVVPNGVFTGKVVEAGSVPEVEFSTDSGLTWSDATVSSAVSPYAWTANVSLVPGANTLQFRATDLSSNVSAVVSRTVTYTVPLPVVGSPTAGAKLASGQVTFTGTVPAAGGMPVVEFSTDAGANWTAAGVSGTKAPYGWSANATLSPGANMLLFRTVDALGQKGQPVSRSVTYLKPSSAPLVLAAQGSGTFTAGLAGKNLNLNMPYKVTATPGKGQIFKEWLKNGISLSRNATLTFTMEEGLVLTPVFIPNAFAAVAGTFNGLLGSGAETDMGAFFLGNGFVTLTTTGTGAFTGSLRLEGQSMALRGKFDGLGEANLTIPRRGKPNALVALKFDMAAAPGEIIGTVTTGGDPLDFIALPGIYTGIKPNIHPLSGNRYTIVLPAPDGTLGHGYATMIVDAKGLAKFAGKLADGTTFTTSARTVDDSSGNWVVPVHIPLYTGFGGMLVGEVVVPKTEPAGGPDVEGSLGWLRPANPKATMFQAGFLKTLEAQGGHYRLTTGQSLLTGDASDGNFTLTIDPGLAVLGSALSQPGTWPKTNVPLLTKPVPAGLKFTFTPTTGVFKGTFARPVGLKKVSTAYEGVYLETPIETLPGSPLRGAGFFITPNAFGQVQLETAN